MKKQNKTSSTSQLVHTMLILSGLNAVLIFCLLWHTLVPAEFGWMTRDQIFGTFGMFLFSFIVTFSIFAYSQANHDQ